MDLAGELLDAFKCDSLQITFYERTCEVMVKYSAGGGQEASPACGAGRWATAAHGGLTLSSATRCLGQVTRWPYIRFPDVQKEDDDNGHPPPWPVGKKCGTGFAWTLCTTAVAAVQLAQA